MAAPCGCGGGAARGPITVSVDGETTSVRSAPPVPGMPRYRVAGSDGGDKEFATYIEARQWKHEHGGTLRAV